MISRMLFALLFGIIIVLIAVFTVKLFGAGFRLSSGTRRELTIPALFFPLTYIATLIAVRSASYGIGPVVYTAMNTLAGFFFYLFLGAIVLAIATGIAVASSSTLPIAVPALILIASLGLAITGLIQARTMQTVSYTVTLSNAPHSWNGKKAVLVADTHFGLVNYKKFSKRVVEKILSEHPDFVLHAGDFYDGPTIDTAPITASWKTLTDAVPVFYTPGNHEKYGNYTDFIQSVKNAGVVVLEDQKTEFDQVQIAGITYRERAQADAATDILNSLALDPHKAAILINHPPTFQKAAAAVGIDLMVSGHTHRGQFWPVNFLVRRIYGKYAYGLQAYDELQTITTSGIGTFGPPFRLFNTPEIVVITFQTI